MKAIFSSVLMLLLMQPAMAQRKINKLSDAPLHMNMVTVHGGNFDMGADDEATDRRPAHTVTLKDYYMAAYEVTQEQWKTVMGSNPSTFLCEECPVNNVTFNDVTAFIEKLNTATGKHYRLPTEAEWEYAARGGVHERMVKRAEYTARGGVNELFVDADSKRVPIKYMTGKRYAGQRLPGEVAWFTRNSEDHVHPIGRKKANELGLYDMSGNVEEWVADWYAGNYGSKNDVANPTGPNGGNAHVVRGGGWANTGDEVTVTRRAAYVPNTKSSSLGFRLAMDK